MQLNTNRQLNERDSEIRHVSAARHQRVIELVLFYTIICCISINIYVSYETLDILDLVQLMCTCLVLHLILEFQLISHMHVYVLQLLHFGTEYIIAVILPSAIFCFENELFYSAVFKCRNFL